MKAQSMKKNMTVRNQEISKFRQIMANVWLLVGLLLLPEMVMANPITAGVDWVLDLLTNGIARSIAIIAIVILGYLAWAGRITAGHAGQFVGGIVLVFGGAAIVDLIIAAMP